MVQQENKIMKLEKLIPREVIENVFVTAIEGGSNYWYYLSDDAINSIRKAVPKSEDPHLSTAIVKAILDHGVIVPINDADNEDDIVGFISRETMQERLQKLLQDDNYKLALEAELSENGDADTSDVVFQFMAMGEVIFG